MKDDQVVEELARTVADLKKRLAAVARMYGKAQIELCSLRRRLGEGSDSGLLKKARAEAIQAATLALKIAEMLEAGVSHETGGQDG